MGREGINIYQVRCIRHIELSDTTVTLRNYKESAGRHKDQLKHYVRPRDGLEKWNILVL